MSKAKFSLNIFHKLWLALLLVTLVPLVSLWYIGGNQAKDTLTNNISNNLVGTTNTVAASVMGWDDTNLRVLSEVSKFDDIRSMKGDRQTAILKAVGASYEWLLAVYVIGPDGMTISRGDDRPMLDYSDRGYFKDIMKGKPTSRQVIISRTSGKPTLALSAPIKDAAGQVVGVLAITMQLDVVSKMVAGTKIGNTGHAILLDADNKVIAHGHPELAKPLQDLSTHPALAIAGITERPLTYTNADGKQIVAFVRKLPQGWTLLVEQDYNEAYAALRSMERNALILIVLSIVAVSAVAYVLGRQLTRPIKQLTEIATQLSSGSFDIVVPQTDRGDEIGSLGRAIERLGVSIQMAMERLRKKSS